MILAVDAGNSKTDVALVCARGRVLGAARGPSFSYARFGLARCMKGLAATLAAACVDARLDFVSLPLAEVGVYCFPGASLRTNHRRLARAVAKRGWAKRDRVLNDTFAPLRMGTERRWGIAVVCGTGMNCVGIAPNGRSVQFPSLGWVSGDWGGGRGVGESALAAAARGRDGRGPRTILEQVVPEYFGLLRPGAVVEAIRSGRLDARRVIELPPLVFAAAGRGDQVAKAILDRLADEVIAMAGAAIRRLRLVRSDVDIVLSGGIFRSEDSTFVDRIEQGLLAVACRARIRVLVAPPVVGAALLGLDELGSAPNAGEHLRKSLTHERLNQLGASA